jgi:hypothetical protein
MAQSNFSDSFHIFKILISFVLKSIESIEKTCFIILGSIPDIFIFVFVLNKKMLPSVKIQNGGWIQDGGENIFFILKFQTW